MLIAPPTTLQLALSLTIPVLVVIVVGWWVRSRQLTLPPRIDRALTTRGAPLVVGALTAALVLLVWGSCREPGIYHDEQAYLLQAQIFATFRWTGETPPIPEFFQQLHVLTEPRLAPKYPPGNALLMVPAIWAGLPGLTSIGLAGISGALLFTLVRRITDSSLAVLTWALWSTHTVGLFWSASYLSQNVTTAFWMLSLAALLRWHGDRRAGSLLLAAGLMGWLYLTRPLTALALSAPAGVFVLVHAWRHKLLGQVALSLGVAVACVAVQLLWQDRTVGSIRENPYVEYSRQYLPFDKPGFGLDSTPASRPLAPSVAWISDVFVPLHAEHVPARVPGILRDRMIALGLALTDRWRVFLLPLFVVGVLTAPAAARLPLISCALLIGVYLIYAHQAWWSVYYVETFPVFAFFASAGLAAFARVTAAAGPGQVRCVILICVVLVTPWLAGDVWRARDERNRRAGFQRMAAAVLERIKDPSAVVFVSYPPGHSFHDSLVVNTPDFRRARLWMADDRPDNDRLLALTDRRAYRLHTDTWTLEPIR